MSLTDDLFASSPEKGIAPLNDEAFEKSYPNLYDLMNRRTYADGTVRCPATIVIRRVPGALEVVLQEHDFLQAKSVMVKTLGLAFKALERALTDTELPWREYKSKIPTPLKKKRDKKKD